MEALSLGGWRGVEEMCVLCMGEVGCVAKGWWRGSGEVGKRQILGRQGGDLQKLEGDGELGDMERDGLMAKKYFVLCWSVSVNVVGFGPL